MGVNGVLIVDKPRGWTSMDVCAKLRGKFHEKRVGHAGTLDPMATGVLPVFLGRATRAVDFVSEGRKEYIAELLLGVVTDTQDVTGRVKNPDGTYGEPLLEGDIAPRIGQKPGEIDANPGEIDADPAPGVGKPYAGWGSGVDEVGAAMPSQAAVEAALKDFVGEISQVPPMYSAIKVQGKKLYELARKGVEIERKSRKITIFELEMLERLAPDRYRIRVLCSKGTYIRTLCHDIGQALGCGGCMAALKRTKVGRFELKNAVSLDEILGNSNPETLLTGVEECFDAPKAVISGLALKRALCGNPFPLQKPAGTYRIFDESGNFLLLGRCDGQECKLIKSFYEVT